MAMSTCVKCGNHSFEIVQKDLVGSRFKMNLVQCNSCGGVVGVTSYYDPGVTANLVKEQVEKLEGEVRNINSLV